MGPRTFRRGLIAKIRQNPAKFNQNLAKIWQIWHPPPKGCFRKPFLDSRTLDLDLDLAEFGEKNVKISEIFEQNFEH